MDDEEGDEHPSGRYNDASLSGVSAKLIARSDALTEVIRLSGREECGRPCELLDDAKLLSPLQVQELRQILATMNGLPKAPRQVLDQC